MVVIKAEYIPRRCVMNSAGEKTNLQKIITNYEHEIKELRETIEKIFSSFLYEPKCYRVVARRWNFYRG